MCGKKIFVCLIFIVPGFRRKFFYGEFFPNHGIFVSKMNLKAQNALLDNFSYSYLWLFVARYFQNPLRKYSYVATYVHNINYYEQFDISSSYSSAEYDPICI